MQELAYKLIAGNTLNSAKYLLCLHGYLGSKNDWDFIIPELSKEYSIIIPDLPGFGDSTSYDLEKPLSYDSISEQVINLLDKLKIKQTHLLGYSMGGRLAFSLALNYPDRFQKLIILSANPGIEIQEERVKRLEQDQNIANKIKLKGLAEFFESWYQAPLFKSLYENKLVFKPLLERRIKENSVEWASKVIVDLSPGKVASLWKDLANLKHDCLYAVGDLDQKFMDIHRKIEKDFKNIKTAIISGAGHNVFEEQPKAVVRVVQEFLERRL